MNVMGRRRALGLLGLGAGAAVVAGCGGDRDGGSGSEQSTTTTTTAAAGSATTSAGGAVTAAMFDGAASCALTPDQTEGPYHIDVDAIRADIRDDRAGVPLRVAARVLDADGCTPVQDAVFEIWHCDATGLYSGFEAASTGRGGGGVTDDERYLRGAQVTNGEGIALITTIYPGWYRGRTVHIHAKVIISNTEVLTTQLYFDDALSDEVHRRAPYDRHPGRDTRNDDDGIFVAGTVLSTGEDGHVYLGLLSVSVSR